MYQKNFGQEIPQNVGKSHKITKKKIVKQPSTQLVIKINKKI